MGSQVDLTEQFRRWSQDRRRLVAAAGIGLLILGLAGWRLGAPSAVSEHFVPLTPGAAHSSAEFRSAQTAWRRAGLAGARFADGTITVPASEVERYRQAWPDAKSSAARSRWADAWQSASDRLGQFSGSRERADAREITRAQVVSRLLEELPDIAAADVVWDEAPGSGWRTPARARATVYLRAAEGCTITPDVVDAVRRAVSGSKANLAPADIAVMDQTRMITYDGNATTAAGQRITQLAATYRTRLEAAFEHFPGIDIAVHADAPPAAEADGGLTPAGESPQATPPAPVTVAVRIPESTIQILAGLHGHPAGRRGEGAVDAGRDVFRSVEQHVYQTIRTKAPLLLPAGLVLTSPDRLHLETIPSPTVPTAAASAAGGGTLTALLWRNPLPWLAAICGLGALWMLRSASGRRSPGLSVAEVATESTAAADSPTCTSQHSPLSEDPVGAAGAASGAALSDEPGVAEGVAAPGGESAVVDAEDPADQWRDAAEVAADPSVPPGQQTSERHILAERRRNDSPADVLHDVLARLQSQSDSTAERRFEEGPESNTSRIPPPSRVAAGRWQTPPHGADRRPIGESRGDRSRSGVDLDQVLEADPPLLAALAIAVDVETWTCALYGSSRATQTRVLSHLPPTAAERLKRNLAAARPVRIRDIDAAHTRIGEAWRTLRQDSPLDDDEPVQAAGERAAA